MSKIHTSKTLYLLRQIQRILRDGVKNGNIHEFKHLTALLHVYAGEPVALKECEKNWPTVAARVAMKAGDTVKVQAICLHLSSQWHLCRGDLSWALDGAETRQALREVRLKRREEGGQ